MALDGLTLAGIVFELRQRLVGGRIERIYQPEARDLDLRIRAAGESFRLRVSADPTAPRLLLARGERPPAPAEPPAFCALARRHVEGGRIRYIRQTGLERVVRIGIESRNDVGDVVWYDLVVEIMGRHSNAILVRHEDGALREEEGQARGRIVDALVRVTPGMSRHRLVLPGQAYVPPPEQGKIDPREERREDFLQWAKEAGDTLDPHALLARYQGIGPVAAKEIFWRAGEGQEQEKKADSGFPERLWEAFSTLFEDVVAGRFTPCIGHDESGRPKAVSCTFLNHMAAAGRVVPFPTVNEAVESFYESRLATEMSSREAAHLASAVRAVLDGIQQKIRRWEEQRREAEGAEQLRRWGELLTAYMHTVPRGAKEVAVPDPYSEGEPWITIPLDPERTPSENAQALFRQYQKHKKTLQVVSEYLEQAQREVEYLESVLVAIEQAEDGELEEIREELLQQGILRPKRETVRKRDEPAAPMHFVSSDGIDILVGKNNRQNDLLTMKIAGKQDTWLHAQHIPGSHVIIRSREVPPRTLEEAAHLAAYYSKARHSGSVPVDYTLVKHVWKPNGARPGFVLYDHQRTIFVTPDPTLPERLRVRPGKPRG
ncbi:MAG: NFACT family protein [Alicyclobacillaceae bacterium]|nr:NFACT family protein [Alicyclobacillaceae bacterium]